MRQHLVIASLASLASFGSLGCGSVFDREVGIAPGEVNGTLRRLDVDAPASFTRAGLPARSLARPR